jgi:hypothetical protein
MRRGNGSDRSGVEAVDLGHTVRLARNVGVSGCGLRHHVLGLGLSDRRC